MELLQQSGLVSLYDYQQLEKLDIYKTMQRFSERFRASHGLTADPFHQWSRRWEYPWVASRIPRLGAERALDAGSGLTFFPFYLSEQNPAAEIHCVDNDAKLAGAYAKVNSPRVRFTAGSLQKLPYEDSFFDSVFCISVLEHTGDFEQIAQEFKRVLKPGGRASITFDICLNGVADIAPERAEDLVRTFEKYFRSEDPNPVAISDLKRPSGFVRTKWIRKNLPSALPWRYPKLTALKAGLMSGKTPRFIDLTFCTLALVRE